MTWIAVAVAGAGIVGSVMSSNAQAGAAQDASNAQTQASQAGIAEQDKQFTAIQQLLSPFVTAGTQSLSAQQDLAGLNGAEAQQKAITQLQGMPGYQQQLKLGENRILANASATGGLRGGNVQGALGYFAPQLLAQTINDQYSRLGGITSLGQNAAAMTGNAGMQTGFANAGLLQQGGAAQAASDLAGGRAQTSMYSGIGGALGTFFGQRQGQFGGGTTAPPPDYSGFGSGPGFGSQDLGQFFSDVRLKTDIHPAGTAANGLPLYRFRYVWGGPEHVGHLAHEVRERFPEAVSEHSSGFLMVDYSKV